MSGDSLAPGVFTKNKQAPYRYNRFVTPLGEKTRMWLGRLRIHEPRNQLYLSNHEELRRGYNVLVLFVGACICVVNVFVVFFCNLYTRLYIGH